MADGRHIYPIGVVQRLTALSPRQIHYYEQCGLVTPERSKGNQRMFSQEDIALLVEIRDRLDEGWLLQAIKDHLASRSRQDRARRGRDGAKGAQTL